MSTDTRTIKATCLCGAAKHEITLPSSSFPLTASLCHCSSCRHMTGTLALTCAGLPASYSPQEGLLDKLTPFAFSQRITQYLCKTCGSLMLAHCWNDADDHEKGYSWDAMSGSLEKADGVVEFKSHTYIGDTLDGGFSDFLPSINGKELARWEQGSGNDSKEGQLLPLHWHSPIRPQNTPSPTDRLYCHCKCKGVEFWIARPSERSKHAAGGWPDALVPFHSPQSRTDTSSWWLRDNDTKFLGDVCACDSCRLDTGQEWHEWMFVPTVDISLDAEGKEPWALKFGAEQGWGTLKGYRSSHKPLEVWRYHCRKCGATVFYSNSDRTNLVDVAVGVLDATEGARAESWIEIGTERLSYREDAVPRAESITLSVENGLKKFGERLKT